MNHTTTKKPRKMSKVAVFADVENCYIPKYSGAIIHFLNRYTLHPMLFAYHYWPRIKDKVQQQMQKDRWKLINTATQASNGLDTLLIENCLSLCQYEIPEIEIVVLITCDNDYAPLIKQLKGLGKKVIVLGRDGKTGEKLKENAEYYPLESLQQLVPA